ncbi:MAG TPA: zinc-ribbon domain-containing protein, partial [Myxococcaceae bacterium]|nr:zinc-ribbon domain-containing protein [Myxococcaceae bacterium]
MDVRCERCQTEYEFDDARITEAGVAVRCTTCNYVFKVQKAGTGSGASGPAAGSPPLRPPDAGGAPAPAGFAGGMTPPGGSPLPGIGGSREWKVRQANGNVFTFRELTTLQKWIVERKVSREDQISLNGETWKKLGGIGELASFFQIVDEAQRSVRMAHAADPVVPAAAPEPPRPVAPTPAPPRRTATPSPFSAFPPGPGTEPSLGGPRSGSMAGPMATGPLRSSPTRSEPAFTGFNQPLSGENEDGLDDFHRSSRAGRNLLVGMLLLVIGVGGAYVYWRYREGLETRPAPVEALTTATPPAAPFPSVSGDAGTGAVTAPAPRPKPAEPPRAAESAPEETAKVPLPAEPTTTATA